MPQIERKEHKLQIDKPENPLTKGFITGPDLAKYFTHYHATAFGNMAKRLKVTAYLFRDDPKTYFSLEEILDVAQPDKMKPIAFEFQDKITENKQKNGFVDWLEIEKEWEESIGQLPDKPTEKEKPKKKLKMKSRRVSKSVKDRTAPMSSPPPHFPNKEAMAEFAKREKQAELLKELINSEDLEKSLKDRPIHQIPEEGYTTLHEFKGYLSQEQKRYSNTTMIMEPMTFSINVTLETEDPEVLMELREIYRRIINLRDRIEPYTKEKPKQEINGFSIKKEDQESMP